MSWLNKILPDDLFACTGNDGVTYNIDGEQFTSLFPTRPWAGHLGGIFHIINVKNQKITLPYGVLAYQTNGGLIGEIFEIEIDQEVVFTTTEDCAGLFEGNEFSTWDFGEETSLKFVTSLKDFLLDCKKFNGVFDGDWSLASCTRLDKAFMNCHELNQPIPLTNLDSVSNASSVLREAHAFNQDINDWALDPTTADNAFQSARALNCDLNNWSMNQLSSYADMFNGASKFNGNIENWDVGNGKDYSNMFKDAEEFTGDLRQWDVPNGHSFKSMFKGATKFNGDISHWNVETGTDFSEMFMDASSFTGDISSWQTIDAINMDSMFENAALFNSNLDQWCVLNFSSMPPNFDAGATSYVLPRPQWGNCFLPPPWVNHPGGVFHVKDITGASELSLNSSYPQYNMDGTFRGNLDTIPAGMEVVFTTPANKTSIFSKRLPHENANVNWNFGDQTDTSQMTTATGMFANCMSFNGQFNGNWDLGIVETTTAMFSNCLEFNQNINHWNIGKVGKNWSSASFMFRGCLKYNQPLNNWDVSTVKDFNHMFYMQAYNVSDKWGVFNQDISGWDVSNATNFYRLFTFCNQFNYDLNSWNVEKVTNMRELLNGCTSMSFMPTNWNPVRCRDISKAFMQCTLMKANEDWSKWSVGNYRNLQDTFRSVPNFNGDLSSWDTTNCTSLEGLFHNCPSFNNSSIVNWNTSNCMYMTNMFRQSSSGARAFNQDISNWDVSKVRNMDHMFYNSLNFNQPVNKWNVQSNEEVYRMFYNTKINYDFSKWCVRQTYRDHREVFTNTPMENNTAWHLPPYGTCPGNEDGLG